MTQPNSRLMVMGYSFSDEHLNEVILDAVKNYNLKIFIVDPAGLAILTSGINRPPSRSPKKSFRNASSEISSASRPGHFPALSTTTLLRTGGCSSSSAKEPYPVTVL